MSTLYFWPSVLSSFVNDDIFIPGTSRAVMVNELDSPAIISEFDSQ